MYMSPTRNWEWAWPCSAARRNSFCIDPKKPKEPEKPMSRTKRVGELAQIIEPCAGDYRNRRHQQATKVHLPLFEFLASPFTFGDSKSCRDFPDSQPLP